MNQHAKRRQQQRASARPDASATFFSAPPGEPEPQRAPRADGDPAPGRNGGEFLRTVGAERAGQRLDRFLQEELTDAGEAISRSRLKTLLETGCVNVDGAPAADPALKVRRGQIASLMIPAPAPAEPSAESIPLAVVFEDRDLIVIDKPAGLVVHPSAGHESGTLVNALIAHCGESLSGIGGVRRPGIVHRLDKDTSGLLVVAKTDAAHQGLARLFADHGRTLGLVREYEALVWGAPERAAGVIDAPIGRHPQARDKQAVAPVRGRQAITHWRTLAAFHDAQGRPLAAHIRCRLETGRTHQIRVHMASIGHPVMGDPLYAQAFKTKSARLAPGARDALAALNRQALHAASLGFPHPITSEELHFDAPAPPDMARLLAALSAPDR